MNDEIPVVFLDDRLWRGQCACTPGCRELVETLRLGTGRYRRMKKVYVATMPSELLDFPMPLLRERRFSMAVLDLDAYPDIDAVMEAARTRTEKRGRVNRDVSRARRLGYYVQLFVFEQHTPDIVEIHQSKAERQGAPLSAYYQKTVDAFGGAPAQPLAPAPPECSEHHWACWGVFIPREGHMQGTVRTDAQLVGYIKMRRQGDSASYTAIMGHGDHLANGIMYLLHFEIVAAMLKAEARERPRYLTYLNYHPRSTLGEWKRRALFEPRYFHYVDERAVAFPDTDPPDPGRGICALKASLDKPLSTLPLLADTFHLTPEWLALLQRAWVMSQVRGPEALLTLLERGPNAIETLRHFCSEMMPLEALELESGVTVALCGRDHGADTLVPLRNAGIRNVSVTHTSLAAVQSLAACYGAPWTFSQWTPLMPSLAGNGAAIVECAREMTITEIARLLTAYRGSLLLSLPAAVLGAVGFDMARTSALYEKDPALESEIAQALSKAFGRTIGYRSIHYRWADPDDVFWLSLRLD